MEAFKDDDAGFVKWRDTHPEGRILSGRSAKPHRTDCMHIAVPFTAIAFSWTSTRKICFGSRSELEGFAVEEGHPSDDVSNLFGLELTRARPVAPKLRRSLEG